MSELRAAEFTGERVIPELVDADLLNEHLARYRFARYFTGGLDRSARILDAGCGSGYGTAELSCEASVTGADISAEAVNHARLRYGGPGVCFLQAACEVLPFSAGQFDLVVAFEVIEHLDRWQELLAEAGRVLKPSGILLVSTPNRDYYDESRGAAGPNPFHRHEFDGEEFREALGAVFPHVRIWTQNHAEAIVFSPDNPATTALEARGSGDPAGAHFYLAACSQSPIAPNNVFAWIPSSGNVLRERERHIAKLNGELEKKDVWLRQTIEAHSELYRNHEALTAELEQRNEWAAELDREVRVRQDRIGELQKELETRLSWIAGLETQIEKARTEIRRLNAEVLADRKIARDEISRLEQESADLQAAWSERAKLAERLSAELETALTEQRMTTERLGAEIAEARGELQRVAASRWVRAGEKLGLGPQVKDGQ